MLHQLGCILWIAWLVRSSFAAKVKENKGSVSAGGHTFNNSPSEAFAQAFEAFAQSSQSTALQVKAVGIGNKAHIHDAPTRGKESAAAQRHANHVPFLALKKETPKTPLLWLMNVSLDRWGHKVNCSTESFDKLANHPSGQEVKSSPIEKMVYKLGTEDQQEDQQGTLLRLVLPVVLFAFGVTLSCSRSTKPNRDSAKACARTEEEWRKQSQEKLSEDRSWTTHVSSGKIDLDVSCVDDNVEHFDMGQETDDEPDAICRACAERAPDMCRTCAESFEDGATLPEKLQTEAPPPLPMLNRFKQPGIVTGTPPAVSYFVINLVDVQGQTSHLITSKGIAVGSDTEVTSLDPAPFPELRLSSSDTEKSGVVVEGDGCERIADPLKAAEAKPTSDSVWVGLPTLDLFMETLGWGRAPRASSV